MPCVILSCVDSEGPPARFGGGPSLSTQLRMTQPMQPHDRLVIAVDVSSRDEVLRMVDTLQGVVGVFKIGLQAFIANGPAIVREVVARGEKVFLDLKIHDIPNTARHAVAEAASLGASMATVHASGGEQMLRACAHDSLLVLG